MKKHDKWESWERGRGIAKTMRKKRKERRKSRATMQVSKKQTGVQMAVKLGEELSCTQRVKKEKQQYAKQLRRQMTAAELYFLQAFSRSIEIKIASQVVISGYIVDFLLPTVKLIIEIDGTSHKGRENYDQQRTERLVKLGYKVIRFSNHRVLSQIAAVIQEMREVLNLPKASKISPPSCSTRKKRGLSLEEVWAMTAQSARRDREKVMSEG